MTDAATIPSPVELSAERQHGDQAELKQDQERQKRPQQGAEASAASNTESDQSCGEGEREDGEEHLTERRGEPETDDDERRGKPQEEQCQPVRHRSSSG